MEDFNFKKRDLLTDQLPATPATPAMRERVEAVAKEKDVSLAAVIRQAVEFFLAAYSGKPIVINGETVEGEADRD